MPTPRQGETSSNFMQRCVAMLRQEGNKPDQAVAVCHSIWEEKEVKKSEEDLDDLGRMAAVNREHEYVAAGRYPEVPKMELPDQLKPRHLRQTSEFEELLRQP